MTCRRNRWLAKRPHNRIQRHRDGRVIAIPEPLSLGTDREDYLWVLAEYRQARYPKPTPEDVAPFDPPPDWRERLTALEQFAATQ